MSEPPQSHDADPVERTATEQEQSELDLGVISTGSEPVDQALRAMDALAERPVGEHPGVFEQVLTDLSATMTDGALGGSAVSHGSVEPPDQSV